MIQYLQLLVFVLALTASLANAQAETWPNLLRRGEFGKLEAQTIALQKRFKSGEATEFELRQAYRSMYNLTRQDLLSLDLWQKTYPQSYAVRLIRGTYYKRAGVNARGDNFASVTPPENFAAMRTFYALALPQLEESLSLTEKPYLSVFHLLDIRDGNRHAQKALMKTGTIILPTNRLVRTRFMRSLAPRWGGSYETMRTFLAEAKRTGATELGLLELEAIIFDETGDTDIRRGDRSGAIRNFRKALEIGARVGGEVPQELQYSWHYRCKLSELKTYCH